MVTRQKNLFVPFPGHSLTRPKPRRSGPIAFIRRIDARVNARLKRIFCWPVCTLLFIAAALMIALAAQVYFKYSAIIDLRLKGKFFDNSSGMYSAPRTIVKGAQVNQSDVVNYLKRADYVDDNSAKGGHHGSYSLDGNVIRIMPNGDDSNSSASGVAITFRNNQISDIIDLDTNHHLNSCFLAPQLLTTLYDNDRRERRLVTYDELPPQLIQAITAIEDQRFFQHRGIDVQGIIRAAWQNANDGQISQGGSTITQQLVKNTFLTNERTYKRKLQEAAFALILELRLTKEQILTLYSNEVYLGQSSTFSIHGFGQAADVYFGKDLSSLTVPEAALLAGMVRGPNRYSPYRNLEQATARRNEVLDKMADAGYISESEAAEYKATPLNVRPYRRSAESGDEAYFIDYVQQYLGQHGDEDLSRNTAMYTTLDPQLQKIAHDAVQSQLAKLDQVFVKQHVPQGTLQAALVAIDAHTGNVVAMIGGRDYDKSQLNRATSSFRQPGSVFKPFVYATALSTGRATAATLISDSPTTVTYDGNREYTPENYGGGYSNKSVTVRYALTHSLNVVTVKLAQDTGMYKIADLAEQAGLPRPRPYPSSALGATEATPLQIASAYTTFVNSGTRMSATPLRYADGGADKESMDFKADGRSVISPAVAYLMTDLMHSVTVSGTAASVRAYNIPSIIAGKTGTSQTRDGWFAGYTPNLICVVWVGFDDNRPLGLTGAESALPIWGQFMKEALKVRPDLGSDHFSRPAGIDEVEIDPETGMLATPACPTKIKELFIAGTAPMAECTHGTKPDSDQINPDLSPGVPSSENDPLITNNSASSEASSSSHEDTVTLDIDVDTGLIATESCVHVKSQTFKISESPTKLCGPEYHRLTPEYKKPSDKKPDHPDHPIDHL